jgi:large-conductance mechanosensitive channel
MSNLLLADPVLASVRGWWIGIIIGVTIVAVVVFLVMTIITQAHKIASQAETGSRGVLDAYANTMAVWELRDINRSTSNIWRAAEDARKLLEGKS